MKQVKYIISLSLILLLSWCTYGQDIKFKASSQTVVAVGERFQISFSINADGTQFKAPLIKNFKLLSGPNPSNSSSISVVNGKMTQSVNKSFSYVLQATKAGKYTIKGATILVEGKQYTSNSMTIEVVKQSNQQAKGQNGNNASNNINPKDLFLKANINTREVFIGQPIQITYKIYSRINLADLQNASFPEYKSFYSQDIEVPQSISLKRENYNGIIYQTALLNKVLLYPQKTGELTIDAASIDAIIQKRVRRQRQSVFDDFFGGGYQQFRVNLESKAIQINVKELPQPTPKSFSGAVGNFKIKTSVDKTELDANDAFTYKISISGTGNLKLLKDPELNFPHDFDLWDPTVKNKIKNTSNGSKGSKTYEYVVQPRHPGNFTIPEYEFSFFNPNTHQFVTAKGAAFEITVKPSSTPNGNVSHAVYSKEDVELIGKDIRYIKTKNYKLKKHSEALFGSLPYYLSFLGLTLLFALMVWLKRKQIQNASNTALMRNKKAKKAAKLRLKEAKKAMELQQTEAFYEAINKGIQKYLSDKLNIDTADYTIDFALAKMNEKGIEDTVIQQYKNLVETCEMARYAPSQINKNLQEIYKDTSLLISRLEDKI